MKKNISVRLTVTIFIFALLFVAATFFLPIAGEWGSHITAFEVVKSQGSFISIFEQLGLNNDIACKIAEVFLYIVAATFAIDILMGIIYLFKGYKARFFRVLNKMLLIVGSAACLVTAIATAGSIIYALVADINVITIGSYFFIATGAITLICFFIKLAAAVKTKTR